MPTPHDQSQPPRLLPPSQAAPSLRAQPVETARPCRKKHPARGARWVALAGSIGTTGLIGVAMSLAEQSPGDETLNLTVSQSNGEATVPVPVTAEPGTATAPLPEPAAESPLADGTYAGTAEYTKWGDVQVQATVSGGQLVDVAALQMPNDRKSTRINSQAAPLLEAQAISTQAADLDTVSGATSTSQTYRASLQAALDQAALAAASSVQSSTQSAAQ